MLHHQNLRSSFHRETFQIVFLGTSVNKGNKKSRTLRFRPLPMSSALLHLSLALRREARHVHPNNRLVAHYPRVVSWRDNVRVTR